MAKPARNNGRSKAAGSIDGSRPESIQGTGKSVQPGIQGKKPGRGVSAPPATAFANAGFARLTTTNPHRRRRTICEVRAGVKVCEFQTSFGYNARTAKVPMSGLLPFVQTLWEGAASKQMIEPADQYPTAPATAKLPAHQLAMFMFRTLQSRLNSQQLSQLIHESRQL